MDAGDAASLIANSLQTSILLPAANDELAKKAYFSLSSFFRGALRFHRIHYQHHESAPPRKADIRVRSLAAKSEPVRSAAALES